MQILQSYYNTVVKQDLLTKFYYVNCLEIPSLEKIVLRFNVTQTSLRNLLPALAALFLISSQKPYLLTTKRINLTLRMKSGVAVSCKVDLRNKEKFFFLERLLFFVIPRSKDFYYTVQQKSVNFALENAFLFKEIEKDYEYFQDLPRLNVHLFFRAKDHTDIVGFLSALKFPLK